MRWILVHLVVLMFALNSQAASIQARLIRASNNFKATDAGLKDLAPKLGKEFGYKYYHLLGEQQEVLDQKDKSRLNLGEGFVVFVTQKSVEKHLHELELEWWSGKALLVKTVVKIPEKRSIFIKGPGVGDDWIVLALSIHE
jgi:hypothetical protein